MYYDVILHIYIYIYIHISPLAIQARPRQGRGSSSEAKLATCCPEQHPRAGSFYMFVVLFEVSVSSKCFGDRDRDFTSKTWLY